MGAIEAKFRFRKDPAIRSENSRHPRVETRPEVPGGFTLIELLVVIAIIAILAGMLLPALARVKRSGQVAVTMNNMRQIVMAAGMYADDNRELYPATMLPPPGGLPATVSFWDVEAYQNALNRYIGGMQGGVEANGREHSKRNVWFDPADPDIKVPAMWGSFSDNPKNVS